MGNESTDATSIILFVVFILLAIVSGLLIFIYVKVYSMQEDVERHISEMKATIGRLVMELNSFIQRKAVLDGNQNKLIANLS